MRMILFVSIDNTIMAIDICSTVLLFYEKSHFRLANPNSGTCSVLCIFFPSIPILYFAIVKLSCVWLFCCRIDEKIAKHWSEIRRYDTSSIFSLDVAAHYHSKDIFHHLLIDPVRNLQPLDLSINYNVRCQEMIASELFFHFGLECCANARSQPMNEC